MSITIDPEFQARIPVLRSEERAQLERSIREAGCRDALVAWQGILLDGHNRKAICEALSLPYKVSSIELPDRNAAMIWIIKNQRGRRNLTPSQFAMLAVDLEELYAVDAKKRQKEHGATAPGRKKNTQGKSALSEPRQARDDAASEMGVSPRLVQDAKKVVRTAPKLVVQAVRDGKRRVSAVIQEMKEQAGVAPHTAHVAHNSGEHEWYTPPEFIASARQVMGDIDCDPASSEIANRTVKADTFYTAEDNGLDQTWGPRVWMNPPYAQPLIAQFAEALAEKFESGEVKEACALVNNGTETSWFQRMLSACSAVCMVKGRVKFLDKDGKPGAPLQGQVVVYMGGRREAFAEAFAGHGTILQHNG